jgi:hypothetical protein
MIRRMDLHPLMSVWAWGHTSLKNPPTGIIAHTKTTGMTIGGIENGGGSVVIDMIDGGSWEI